MLTNEYLDELERLCEAANDILDFDYEAQGYACMPLLKSHRDMLQCGIDIIPALVAEVRRLSEWPPIETAPNMEDCLIYSNREIFSAYKNKQGQWIAPDPHGVGQCFILNMPTHWRPLPDPPKNANE